MIFYNMRLLKTSPEKDCLETVITPALTYQITRCAIFFAVITGKLEGRFFWGESALDKNCVARPHQTPLFCLSMHQPARPIQMNETRSVPRLWQSLLAGFRWVKAKRRMSVHVYAMTTAGVNICPKKSETVCPGQPENLQNCLSKHKVNIFWAKLKNIIDSKN